MIFFGLFILVGILFVGFLILGAALAAKPDTRTAGLWIMGITFGIAVALPLAWLLSSSGAPSTTWAQGADGRMIPVTQRSGEPGPILAIGGLIFLFAVVAGMIALLANPRTRKMGFAIVGALVVFLVGYLVVGSAMLHVKPGAPSPPVAVQSAPAEVWDESHQIPVEQTTAGSTEAERVTTPAPVETAAPPPAVAPVDVRPKATEPPAVSPPAASVPATPTPTPAPAASSREHVASAKARATPAESGVISGLITGDKDSLPEWAKQSGGIMPDGTYFTVVKVGPNLKFNDCWTGIRPYIDAAVYDYHTFNILGKGHRLPTLRLDDDIRKKFMADNFLERGESSVGEVYTLYTRVAFTPNALAALRSWQTDLLASNRMLFTTIIGALLVGLVGVAYAYFRIDTATLGYYTWRLRFVALFLIAGLTISGIAAGAVFFDEESRLGGINF